MMRLTTDFWVYLFLLLLGGGSFLFYLYSQKFLRPALWTSNSSQFRTAKGWGDFFFWGAAFFFLLAYFDFHFVSTRRIDVRQKQIPRQGAAIYLVLDRSGSMGAGEKLSELKRVSVEFVKERSQELIGVIAFARGAELIAPLSYDYEGIVEKLLTLDVIDDPEEDATSIGYAIYKSVSLIAATRHFAKELEKKGGNPYSIEKAYVILVTDGLQAPSPLDRGRALRTIELQDAGKYAQENDVTLFLMSIDPKMGLDQFAAHRRVMRKIAEDSGGQFLIVDQTSQLPSVLKRIGEGEKSVWVDAPPVATTRLFSTYPFLIGAGLIFLLIGVWNEVSFAREVP